MTQNIFQLIEEVPIADIASKYLRGYRHSGAINDTAYSPFSNDNDRTHLRINKRKNVWFDYSANFGGNAVRLVQEMYRITAIQAAKKIIEDSPELFPNVDFNKLSFKRNPIKKHEQKKEPRQNPVLTDLAYRCLMKISFLTKKDREILHTERHMTDEEIEKYGLFSMPACTKKMRDKLRNFVTSHGGHMDLFRNVPGFFEYKGETFWNYGYAGGIAIPAVNIKGHRISGIQIRLTKKTKSNLRYIWLSSANVTARHNKKTGRYSFNGTTVDSDFDTVNKFGASVGTPIATFHGRINDHDLIITEGFFKGLQYYKRTHCTVAALPGVGNFQNLHEIFEEIEAGAKLFKSENPNRHINRVYIGYDADSVTVPQVFWAECRLYSEIRKLKSDARVFVMTWDKVEGKGFDDLVFNHPDDYKKYIKFLPFKQFYNEHKSLLNELYQNQKR